MEVIFRMSDDVLTADIKGDIDHHSASYLRQNIDKSMKEFNCSNLILDFSEVGYRCSAWKIQEACENRRAALYFRLYCLYRKAFGYGGSLFSGRQSFGL